MYKPLISIIIPTLNSEATLGIALDSIINQSYQNWEVIILDGLSTDKTLEISKQFQLRFPNIQIISEADKGIYDAMNKGVAFTKGEWLYFMGSDDSLFKPNTFEQFLNLENIENFDVIYGNVHSSRFNGFYDGEFDYTKLTTKNICHQAIFFNRTVFRKIGKFNLKYEIQADWEHNIRWFFSSKVSKMYANITIANYADGGFSSSQADEVLRIDKYFLFLRKGKGKLSVSELFKMCNFLINFTKREKQYFKWFMLKIYKYKLRVERKLGINFNY